MNRDNSDMNQNNLNLYNNFYSHLHQPPNSDVANQNNSNTRNYLYSNLYPSLDTDVLSLLRRRDFELRREQNQQRSMQLRNSVDAQATDPSRFISFLETGNNSFLTPWISKPDAPKIGNEHGGCNNGDRMQYMKLELGSLFAHEVHDLKPEQQPNPTEKKIDKTDD
ncbi:hypothetical protein TEA_018276 [Camellia sinensis var. sinensis]|uniref:Uncharacterized protein n=1 Tax=Camellia sinensis var. sinensis TaxID=542762 RepID=A0A4V3WKV5_CAMSN|nr:hypothetical protein TEA_018276 [Camellia sinensis var. sinensis]